MLIDFILGDSGEMRGSATRQLHIRKPNLVPGTCTRYRRKLDRHTDYRARTRVLVRVLRMPHVRQIIVGRCWHTCMLSEASRSWTWKVSTTVFARWFVKWALYDWTALNYGKLKQHLLEKSKFSTPYAYFSCQKYSVLANKKCSLRQRSFRRGPENLLRRMLFSTICL